MYSMGLQKFSVDLNLVSKLNNSSWVTFTDSIVIKYGESIVTVGYDHQSPNHEFDCKPLSQGVLAASAQAQGAILPYSFAAVGDQPAQELTVTLSCPRSEGGDIEGMTATIEKRLDGVSNPVEFEKNTNDGACAKGYQV